MNYVNHGSVKRLARKFLGSKGMRIKGIHMMLAEELGRWGEFSVKNGN
jgi:hypothetical protein